MHFLAENVKDPSHRGYALEMMIKGSLPMEGVDMEPEPRNPYSPPRQMSTKQKGHNFKSPRSYSSQSLYYSSSAVASPGGLRSWQSKDTLGHRHGQKKLGITEKELHNTLYMPPQPYFVTNSKTEVTVWASVLTGSTLLPVGAGRGHGHVHMLMGSI